MRNDDDDGGRRRRSRTILSSATAAAATLLLCCGAGNNGVVTTAAWSPPSSGGSSSFASTAARAPSTRWATPPSSFSPYCAFSSSLRFQPSGVVTPQQQQQLERRRRHGNLHTRRFLAATVGDVDEFAVAAAAAASSSDTATTNTTPTATSDSSFSATATAASAASTTTTSEIVGTGDIAGTDVGADALAMLQTQAPDYEQVGKKVLNGLILAVSFGYAAYTIFDIDHGMTRGWTQSEIAMRIPFDNWNNYETSLAEKPIETKTLINVVIYLLGDWLSQTVFQKKNVLDFDPVRVLRNGLIGLGFGPLVHEYYQFSDHILPVDGGLLVRLQKIVMDQTLYLTVKCSIYIMAVGLLAGDDFETVKGRVKDRIGGIVFTAWKFWPLVHCITYGVIPARHRILWVNCVDLIWNAILASMSNGKKVDEETADEQVLAAVSPEGGETAAANQLKDLPLEQLDPFLLTQELLPTKGLGVLFDSPEEDVNVEEVPTASLASNNATAAAL